MATRLIRRRELCEDSWQGLADDAAAAPAGDLLLSLPQWQSRRAEWLARAEGRLAVRLAPADDPAALREDLPRLAMIAVDFPAFTDGRGFSTARLLRERLGWTGELRAVGDVFRDQLFYLSRVGFDAFLLRAGEDAEAARASLDSFSEVYQSAVDQPLPLFRRRLA
ncbi:MAG: DUF934 domain-containing protein [Pseudomonadota bacterium]|nr:DUF934 domain-containing protein [Pseudomonadota bacterium]